eukprot:scaffold55697_cov55-Phaeocystis_antarctica.AAC.2
MWRLRTLSHFEWCPPEGGRVAARAARRGLCRGVGGAAMGAVRPRLSLQGHRHRAQPLVAAEGMYGLRGEHGALALAPRGLPRV